MTPNRAAPTFAVPPFLGVSGEFPGPSRPPPPPPTPAASSPPSPDTVAARAWNPDGSPVGLATLETRRKKRGSTFAARSAASCGESRSLMGLHGGGGFSLSAELLPTLCILKRSATLRALLFPHGREAASRDAVAEQVGGQSSFGGSTVRVAEAKMV